MKSGPRPIGSSLDPDQSNLRVNALGLTAHAAPEIEDGLLNKKFDALTKHVVLPWQNPILNMGLHVVDPLDWIARTANHRRYLPKYSTRVRSNGVRTQFGGWSFESTAKKHARLLADHASLNSASRVLEIGCGCGRVAFELAKTLHDSNYTGMDIDRVALQSCERNPIFIKKRFNFALMNVRNGRYNPHIGISPSEYKFPCSPSSFDVIFLICVFTYMLPAGVRNYIAEIGRILAPNGVCMMSAFLMDYNRTGTPRGMAFPYSRDEYHYVNRKLPEALVGYQSSFFQDEFAKHGMHLAGEPLLGRWRRNPQVKPTSSAKQDFLFFRRDAQSAWIQG